MKKVIDLWEKVVYTIKNDGLLVCLKKIRNYIIINLNREKMIDNIKPEKAFMDVLFINGCYLPHPSRYRVTHQREQLSADNISNNEVFYENISLDMVKNYRVFIFFRCVYTEKVGEFIKLAKAMNKVVLFDIDDLVIDLKYTNTIKYLDTMNESDRREYDSGVERMKQTLLLCDGAITTTERLANELKKYVPEVFINRNTASEAMINYSEEQIYQREVLAYRDEKQAINKAEQSVIKRVKKEKELRLKSGVRLGYFSGSITHNDDFQMILPVISKLMNEYSDLELHVVGELDIPIELKKYSDRIITHPFAPWQQLPKLISEVHINLAPLEWSIFNEAKSENKWVEAALVKVVTVASKVGAFEKMIQDGETGILCENNEQWYSALKKLIEDSHLRKHIANQAYQYAKRECTTIYKSFEIGKYIRKKMKPNIAFILPSLHVSGGVMVAIQHCCILKKHGYDVIIINEAVEQKNIIHDGIEIPVISNKEVEIIGQIDKGVATLWSTTEMFKKHSNIKSRYYLVQNFETDFYSSGNCDRIKANKTYNLDMNINYVTISKWCQDWLKSRYEKECKYSLNGIDLNKFTPIKRNFSGKVKILVEGNCDDYYKNVDESFQIVDKLDKNKFEIHFLSYVGKPKPYYYVDEFYHNIPHEKVGQIYQKCDILIKSSILESFSYPPLEMMATGGYVVVAPNEGNVEYLVDEENCLFYERGNIQHAVELINQICNDEILRDKLYANGLNTAKSREWKNVEKEILSLYD